ncbi:uncharacterized protein Nnp-1 isoform X2 [Panulirus ornatus]|uniref:uncharacterized protein Nnp-1 isoform X2 n=1 Tax=Panulirus ornatus TaxID=150431 RepID=UPI003A8AEA2F
MVPSTVASNVGTMSEILFAQRLADNQKKIRDRALKKLKKYLLVRSSSGQGFSDDDALKLWKGLFYCMYMADKPLVQEGLAEEISGLIHFINNVEDCRCFIRAAFVTFGREWSGIDVFRIDKFMMFVRRLLRQVFVHFRALDWDITEVCSFATILEVTLVCPEDDVNVTPLELKLHICDIILEELAKIGGENLKHQVVMAIIQPYFKVLALSKLEVYIKSVREGIIRHLIRQSNLGVEHDEGQKKSRDAVTDDSEDEEVDGSEEDDIMDPRAGLVDAFIPQLKPDFNLLADALQSIGAVPKVRKANRETIYLMVKELQDAAKGFYPLALPDRNVDDVDISASEVEKAVERLQKFQENLLKSQKVEDNDDDEDLDLKPLRKCGKKKKGSFKKRRQNKKKGKKEKDNGLSKKQKQQLEKHQRALKLKRRQAVENKLKAVLGAAGIKSSINKMSISDTERKAPKGLHGFEVTSLNQHTKTVNSAHANGVNSFVVEHTKSIKSGKKRKNTDIEKTVKKKKNSFTVSKLQQPSKESFSDDQNHKGENNTLKAETCTDSIGNMTKESDAKSLNETENTLTQNHGTIEGLDGTALIGKKVCKENGGTAKPNGREIEATSENEVPTHGNGILIAHDEEATLNVKSRINIACSEAVTLDDSSRETLLIASGNATSDDTDKGIVSNCNEAVTLDDSSIETVLIASGNATSDDTDKEIVSNCNEVVTLDDSSRETLLIASGNATSDDKVKGIVSNNSDNVVAPKNSHEFTDLVINFSDDKNKRVFGGDTGTTKRSPWDKPLQAGEFEVFIKSKRQIKKEKKKGVGLKKVRQNEKTATWVRGV